MSAGPRGRDGVPERPSCKYPMWNTTDGKILNSRWHRYVSVYICTVFDWSQTSEPKHRNVDKGRQSQLSILNISLYTEICMAVRKEALTGLLGDCFNRNSTLKCWHSCIGADDAGTDKCALTYDQFLQFRRQKGDKRQARFVPNKRQKKHRPVSVSFL